MEITRVVVDEASARTLLLGLAPKLVEVIEGAWNDYLAEGRLRSRRTRANVIWDSMASRAESELLKFPDVRKVLLPGSLPIYVVQECLALRLKKLTRRLGVSNIPTLQQAGIAHQLSLEGLPPVTFLACGYVLDLAEAGIERIAAVKHLNEQVEWAIDLEDLARGELSPSTPQLPLEQPRPVRLPAIKLDRLEKDGPRGA